MILETIRMVADALATGSIGVNAQLPTIPRDASDAQPPDVQVFDSTRNGQVALGRYPQESLPCITVEQDGDVDLKGTVSSGYRDGVVSVIVRYLVKDIDSAEAATAVYLTLRAIQKSIQVLSGNDDGMRNRNNVMLLSLEELTHVNKMEAIDDAFCTSAIRATFSVRDIDP